MGDLIHRYGVILLSYHQQLQDSLMPLLVDPRPISVRKRAYVALCEFVFYMYRMYRTCAVHVLYMYRDLQLKFYLIINYYFILGYLSSCCSQGLYDVMMTSLINNLKAEGSSLNNTRTFIQCIGAIRWAWF